MSTDRTRRAILAGMPLALLAAHPAFRARVWAQAPSTGRLIVQRAVPLAAEMPLSGFGTWITPNDLFHILTTMANPLPARSEEHTSELQSRGHLVCRLLLEKKKKK